MECSVCKSARVLSGGTTAAPHVQKGSMLQVGDTVKVGEANSTVKSIDTKNADYDVITFAAAATGATEGVDVPFGRQSARCSCRNRYGLLLQQRISDRIGRICGYHPPKMWHILSLPHGFRVQPENNPENQVCTTVKEEVKMNEIFYSSIFGELTKQVRDSHRCRLGTA
ncbi:MAG: hypothetical protein ACLTZY_16095 [Alistipes indistinctus]